MPELHPTEPLILVVEDDPEINELIGAYVELAGFSCRRVMRGEDALRALIAKAGLGADPDSDSN